MTHLAKLNLVWEDKNEIFKPKISLAVQGKKIIGALGMPITIPTQKQADKTYEKRTEQYHKIKDTYGSTITDSHQMSFVPLKATPVSPDTQTITETPKTVAEMHENNKTALIVGSITE